MAIRSKMQEQFYFYPRSPRGERLVILAPPFDSLAISIHAPREGSDKAHDVRRGRRYYISIHAPREGSDLKRQVFVVAYNGISIHAPREGSDLCE